MSNNKTGLRHAMLNSDILAGEFCEILTLDSIFGDLVQCEGGLPMPFEANVPDPSTGEMLGVATGVGGLTEGASTSIWVPDYLGVYKEVLANKPAWEGARWDGDAAYAEPGYPVPRLVYAPEATNECVYARDLSAWIETGTPIVTGGATGIDGANSAYSIEDTGAGFNGIKYDYDKDGSDFALAFSLRKDGTGIFAVQVNAPTSIVQIDPSTGNWAYEPSYQGMITDVSVESDGDFWRVTILYSNTTATIDVYLFPGRTTILGNPAVDSAAGNCVVDAVCIWDDTLTINQAKALPPIFTAGATVTRTARALSFDGANHDPDQSGYYFEWEPAALPTGESGSWGILTFDGVSTNTFYHHDGATPLRIRQWYGANTSRNLDDGLGGGVVHPSAFVIDTDEADSLSAWDNDAGDWTAPLGSSGSPTVSTINLGQGSPYVIKFGPIRRYQAPLEEMKAQLEADIAAGEAA